MSRRWGFPVFNWKQGLIFILFVLIATFAMKPSQLLFQNIKAGSVSQENIYASSTVTYNDLTATKKLQTQAASKIQNVYDMDPTVLQNATTNFDNFINSVLSLESQKISKKDLPGDLSKLTNPYNLSEKDIQIIYNLSGSQLLQAKQAYDNDLKQTYATGITTKDLATAQKQFEDKIAYVYLPDEAKKILTNALSNTITPNLKYDENATQKAIAQAKANVQPVVVNLKKGQLIIGAGEVITPQQITELTKLGMISTKFNIENDLMRLPFIFVLFLLLHFYTQRYYPKSFSKIRHYLFNFAMIGIGVLLTDLLRDTWFMFFPMITVLVLATIVWGRRYALAIAMVMGLLLGMKINDDYMYIILSLIWGMSFSLLYNPKKGKRTEYVLTCLKSTGVVLLANLTYLYAYLQVFDMKQWIPLLVSSASAIAFSYAALPFVESLLGVVTPMRLYELSERNHPLLKKLMTVAPGTWDHSFMVGNLAESAAEKIGIDGVLLRVGAYYHDIGKIKNPEFFVENFVPGKPNPHDRITPLQSAQIIMAHPLDSVQMCKEVRLPEPVIDLIASHHSDAVLEQFYVKAKESNMEVDREQFRYQTPTPKTKEQGLLLLADSTEAYFRSVKDVEPEEVHEKIKNLLFQKFSKGDLRECGLTLSDIQIVLESFTKDIINSRHQRNVKYPDEKQGK